MLKKFFFFLILFSLILFSCDSKENAIESIVATCDDGVMNGDETDVDCGGSCEQACITGNVLEGVVVSVIQLMPDEEYVLTGPLVIRDGGELNIRAGTTIKALKGNDVYIAIAQGGKLYAYGMEDAPIVFTSAEENPQPGDWGGLIIFGKAPINSGDVSRSELLDFFYGGEEIEDSSGFLRYLRVEYSGAMHNETYVFSGITFYGVGRFTTVNHVQSYNTLGNGFDIVGGTVEPKNMIAIESGKSAFKIDEGWNGIGYKWYASNFLKAGLELGNNKSDFEVTPVSAGTISEISLLGPSDEGAILINNGGGVFQIEETYTSSFDLGIQVEGFEAVERVDSGDFNILNIEFSNIGQDFISTNYIGPNISFFSENKSLGAGNRDAVPDWAIEWGVGF